MIFLLPSMQNEIRKNKDSVILCVWERGERFKSLILLKILRHRCHRKHHSDKCFKKHIVCQPRTREYDFLFSSYRKCSHGNLSLSYLDLLLQVCYLTYSIFSNSILIVSGTLMSSLYIFTLFLELNQYPDWETTC